MSRSGGEDNVTPTLVRCFKVENTMYTIGNIDPYVMGECFTEYASRIEMFFKANDIPEEKKVPILVTMAGASLYSVAVTVCAPDDPGNKTYAELIKVLKDYFSPVVNVVSERYQFRKLKQSSEQSINDYLISLKVQAQSCDYGQFLTDALRDQFLAGVTDHELRMRMLREPKLTLAEACEIARAWEASKLQSDVKEEIDLCTVVNDRGSSVEQPIHARKVQQYAWNRRRMINRNCQRCGCVHNRFACPAKAWKCCMCGKQGHASKMCRTKKKLYMQNLKLN
ncbi:uncharacterized protein LOC125766922 [Anopheles funestus]|uniref:uncharacterized protein LOC125766922 n=1 Tax=Anopheles funestus TaxID=62324 RepID=UPI0020C5F0F7|nr:uncharacterized protein LOC125766922 [Anopheles funestus]